MDKIIETFYQNINVPVYSAAAKIIAFVILLLMSAMFHILYRAGCRLIDRLFS